MGIEVVQYHTNFFGRGEVNIPELPQTFGKVLFSTLSGSCGLPTTCQWLKEHEHIAGSTGERRIGISDEVKQYFLRFYKEAAFGRQPLSLHKRILHQAAIVQLVGIPWRFHAGR